MRHRLRHYYGAHLHRRLFGWFGASIFATGIIFFAIFHLTGHNRAHPPNPFLIFGVAALSLWAASGKIARRISRPLYDLVQVTKEIGAGKLSARASLACGGIDELSVLGRSVNDMAERIERQLSDQKQLLAEVSHELRTPLARIRLLVEIARGGKFDGATLDDIERETVEIDALVGELLATARLDFSALARRPLDAADLARRAVERAGLALDLLAIEGDNPRFEGDATLMARALANLIDNARKHGGGVQRVCVRSDARAVAFEIDDSGPGFAPGEIEKLTAALAHGERPKRDGRERPEGSLGLGLALVQRIAGAHAGRLSFANRAQGGARVTLEVARN